MAAVAVDGPVAAEADVDAAVAAAEGMDAADRAAAVEGTKDFATDLRRFSRIDRTTRLKAATSVAAFAMSHQKIKYAAKVSLRSDAMLLRRQRQNMRRIGQVHCEK